MLGAGIEHYPYLLLLWVVYPVMRHIPHFLWWGGVSALLCEALVDDTLHKLGIVRSVLFILEQTLS